MGVYDFIELYALPDTLHLLPEWRALKIPYTIHAPHFNQGINLADAEKFSFNRSIFEDVYRWADGLDAEFIIFHPGVLGTIDETVRQIQILKDARMIVENKPPYQVPSMRQCRGADVREIQRVVSETGVRTCLDIGHAMCSAAHFGKDPYEYLRLFRELEPVYYHFVDNYIGSSEDRHLHLGAGNYDFEKICHIISGSGQHILLETNKSSKTQLSDFHEDIQFIKPILRRTAP